MLTEISCGTVCQISQNCHHKRSTMWKPRGFCTVKLKNKGPEPLMGTQISEMNTNQSHCLPICATFTLCSDMFLFLYWSNTLKEQSGFLVFMANAIICFIFKSVEIVKIRGAPIFTHKWEVREAQGALDSQRGAVSGKKILYLFLKVY